MSASPANRAEGERVLREIANQIVDLSNKRHVEQEVETFENAAKRIRVKAEEDVRKEPERASEIERDAERDYSEILMMLWNEIKEEMVATLAEMDFDKVYEYTFKLPMVNQTLRDDGMFWRRRLILEYPDYWMLNTWEDGRIKPHIVEQLLADTIIGSGPRSRNATVIDAPYLLYQKARRLTRYISRVASTETTALTRTVQPSAIIPFESSVGKLAGGGPFVVVFQAVKREPENPDGYTAIVEIFDMRTQGVSTMRKALGNERGKLPRVSVGQEFVLFHWKENRSMNVINLSVKEWLFPTNISLREGMANLKLKKLFPNDMLQFVSRFVDVVGRIQTTSFEIPLSKFREWLADRGRPMDDLHDWRRAQLPGRSIVEPKGPGSQAMVLKNPWLPGVFSLKARFTPERRVVRSNLANSYERPILFEQRWNEEYNILTDGTNIRRAEKYDEQPLYSISAMGAGVSNDRDHILLEDRRNEMRTYGAMLSLHMELEGDWFKQMQEFFVYGNFICRLMPAEARVVVYDLWNWYKANRGSDAEKIHPLISAPSFATTTPKCDLCGTEAAGVCSVCKRVNYCSAKCQARARKTHQKDCDLVK